MAIAFSRGSAHAPTERGAKATHATRKCARESCRESIVSSSTLAAQVRHFTIVRNNSDKERVSSTRAKERRNKHQDEQAIRDRGHDDLHEDPADAF